MNEERGEFYFDASCLEHKRANEKRELVYEFTSKRDDGRSTKNDERINDERI